MLLVPVVKCLKPTAHIKMLKYSLQFSIADLPNYKVLGRNLTLFRCVFDCVNVCRTFMGGTHTRSVDAWIPDKTT